MVIRNNHTKECPINRSDMLKKRSFDIKEYNFVQSFNIQWKSFKLYKYFQEYKWTKQMSPLFSPKMQKKHVLEYWKKSFHLSLRPRQGEVQILIKRNLLICIPYIKRMDVNKLKNLQKRWALRAKFWDGWHGNYVARIVI